MKEQHLQPQNCSLAQCFQLYTKEEQVRRRRDAFKRAFFDTLSVDLKKKKVNNASVA